MSTMESDPAEPTMSPTAAVTLMENDDVSSQLLSATSSDKTSDVSLSSKLGNMPFLPLRPTSHETLRAWVNYEHLDTIYDFLYWDQ